MGCCVEHMGCTRRVGGAVRKLSATATCSSASRVRRMILTHVMAKRGAESELFAAAIFSVPWNFAESQRMLEEPINKLLFNRHFVHDLHGYYLRYEYVSVLVSLSLSHTHTHTPKHSSACTRLRLRA